MNPISRLLNALRSPRLAAALLAVLVAYLAVAAVLPGLVAAPYANPFFLTLVLALAVCTAACAWQRSARAIALTRSGRDEQAPIWSRATVREFVLVDGADPDAVRAATSGALRGLRVRQRPDGTGSLGSRGVASLVGSPLFHWALVALFVLPAAGQAVRHDGVLVLFAAQPVIDRAESYTGTRDAGPLFSGRHTGVTLELLEARRNLSANGVDRGPSPRIQATNPQDGSSATAWVYPNSPLRFGGLMVSRVDSGPGVELALAPAAQPSAELTRTVPLSSADSATGPYSAVADIEIPGSTPLSLRIQQRPGSRIAVSSADTAPLEIAAGQSATIDGVTIRFVAPTSWASVAVVTDPSVPWLYATMVLALLGVALALFYPHRAVSTRLLPSGAESNASTLQLRALAARIDPAFSERVFRAVAQQLEARGLL